MASPLVSYFTEYYLQKTKQKKTTFANFTFKRISFTQAFNFTFIFPFIFFNLNVSYQNSLFRNLHNMCCSVCKLRKNTKWLLHRSHVISSESISCTQINHHPMSPFIKRNFWLRVMQRNTTPFTTFNNYIRILSNVHAYFVNLTFDCIFISTMSTLFSTQNKILFIIT